MKMASDSGDDSSNLSKSPREFTDDEVNHLKDKEFEPVPLQTPWTFWLDKYVFFFLRLFKYIVSPF